MDRVTSIKLILSLDTSFPIAQNNASYCELTNKIGIRCAIVSCFYFSLNVMMVKIGIELNMTFVGSCQIRHFFRLD